jgi:intracellular multiplication protein IcmP
MPAPAQQPQQQGDNSLAALWITIFFFALLAVIWYVFHTQIVGFIFKLKYLEASFVSLFVSKAIPLTEALHDLNPTGVKIQTLISVVSQVGQYIRYPSAVILVILAVVLFYTHPTLRFKRTHSMKTLYEQEKFNWPQVMPVSTIDLVKEPIDKGPWAMSLTPLQFAKKHRLIIEEREKATSIGGQREKVNIALARAEAHQVFAMQLGPYWNGIEKLSMHTKALFAVFVARANHDQDTAKKILDQLALSSVNGQLDFSGVEDVIRKYKDSAFIKKITECHAYVMTVMSSMLEAARQDGVLASADFLWVKIVDRQLWYILNNIGRQTAFVETAGIFAHWLAEKKLGRRISVPMVEEAVKAMEAALKEVVYIPDSEER